MRGTGHGGSAAGFEDGGGHTVRQVRGLSEQPSMTLSKETGTSVLQLQGAEFCHSQVS